MVAAVTTTDRPELLSGYPAYLGEGRDEGGEEEPEDDKDDSETDHDVYLVSVLMFGRIARVSAEGIHLLGPQAI